MYWTLGANATPYASLTVNGVPQFQAANPAGGVPNGTTITAPWLSDVQGELLNILFSSGISPAVATPTQVLQGVKRLFGGNVWQTNVTATLSPDAMGLIELTGSAAFTTTLPSPASSVNPPITIWNASSAPQTLATPAGVFEGPGGSSAATMTVAAGQMLLLRSDGANYVATPPLSSGSGRIGVVEAFAGGTLPANAAWCNGQALSRTTYAALFAVIGTTWGAGDGSTTFNVPDVRGRTIFGADTMGGTGAAGRLTSASMGTTAALGVTGGNELQQQHTHGVTDPGHAHAFTALQAVAGGGSTGSPPFGSEVTNTQSATTGISIQNTGGGTSQNIPPAAVMSWIIWTA